MIERSESKLKRKALYDAFKESKPDFSSSGIIELFFVMILSFIIIPWIVYRIVKEYKDNLQKEEYLPDGSHTIDKKEEKICFTLLNGKRNGLYEEFYKNGNRRFRINYKDGKKDGSYEEWYENGKINYTTNYIEDVQEGKACKYDKSGNLLRKFMVINGSTEDEIKYDKKGPLNGLHEEWNNDYSKKFLEKSINYKDGKRHGVYEEYDQDGNRVLKCNYKNNKRDGEEEEYYDNGKKKFTTNWKDGLQEGKTCTYDIEGALLREVDLINGKYIGDAIEYYKNGHLRMKNNGSKYSFYVWNKDSSSEIKRCDVDIQIDEVKPVSYSFPKASNMIFKGIWTNFRKDGSVEYTLDFGNGKTGKEGEGVLVRGKWETIITFTNIIKITYSAKGEVISNSLVSCKYLDTSHTRFHSYFARARLIQFQYAYSNGIMGPPGAGTGYIDIKPILGIEDIVQII
jgi:antitoxin component YwqK of YwqJK toxin-antitoxin module